MITATMKTQLSIIDQQHHSLHCLQSDKFLPVPIVIAPVWADRSPPSQPRNASPRRQAPPTDHQRHHRRRHNDNVSTCHFLPLSNDGYMNEVAKTTEDRQRLSVTRDFITAGGFYHGAISAADARLLLENHPVGTFLVRDSSERGHYPFSVTVRIAPVNCKEKSVLSTSIRIVYRLGRFRFDGIPETVDRLPNFDCVVKLLCHHIDNNAADDVTTTGSVIAFVGKSTSHSGNTLLPVLLRKPLPVSGSPATLKHLCRRRLNSLLTGRNVDRLHLLPSLKQYLRQYPYDL